MTISVLIPPPLDRHRGQRGLRRRLRSLRSRREDRGRTRGGRKGTTEGEGRGEEERGVEGVGVKEECTEDGG